MIEFEQQIILLFKLRVIAHTVALRNSKNGSLASIDIFKGGMRSRSSEQLRCGREVLSSFTVLVVGIRCERVGRKNIARHVSQLFYPGFMT